MYLAGAVVASWSLTQEVAGSSPFNDKYFFVTEFAEFSENILEKTPITLLQHDKPRYR